MLHLSDLECQSNFISTNREPAHLVISIHSFFLSLNPSSSSATMAFPLSETESPYPRYRQDPTEVDANGDQENRQPSPLSIIDRDGSVLFEKTELDLRTDIICRNDVEMLQQCLNAALGPSKSRALKTLLRILSSSQRKVEGSRHCKPFWLTTLKSMVPLKESGFQIAESIYYLPLPNGAVCRWCDSSLTTSHYMPISRSEARMGKVRYCLVLILEEQELLITSATRKSALTITRL